jgi:hypothetical protein
MNHTIKLYDPALLTDPASAMALTERSLGQFQPLEISPEAFTAAYDAAIGDHVEKNYKGLSYLSWPFAFRYLKEHFPTLFVAFEEASLGWPVFGQEGCYLLRPYLTDGIKRTPALVFPLMDNKHNALKQLDARAISDNIQRASVKAIATFTGLGLRLYAGEDIPKESDEKESPKLPLQQEETKPPARRSTKKETAPTTPASAGDEGPAPASEPAAFDGKAALLTICKANVFDLADELTSLKAGKAALQHLGLNKGEDIKDAAMLGNVVTTMLSQWISKENITVTKASMEEAITKLRAICEEGTPEQVVEGLRIFVKGKK